MRRRRTTSHENGFGRQDLEAGSSKKPHRLLNFHDSPDTDEQDEQLNLAPAIRDMLG